MTRKGPQKKVVLTERAEDSAPASVSMVLHPVQKAFVDCNALFKSFVAGIASGKSYVGAYDLLLHAKPGNLVVVAGPTYRQLSDATMRSFIDVATKLGLWNENQYRKTDNVAKLNNNVEVLFRSSDNPASNRGPSLHYAWLDEAGLMPEEMFNVMIGRLRGGGEQGRLTATFTPQGKEHWTYRLFADASNPNVALYYCSTKDNPFIAPEIYQNLLLQYGKGEGGILRAQQELEGKFVCVEGSEWPPEWFGPDVWFDDFPEDAEALRAVMLDSSKGIGGKTGDYACFALGSYSRGCLYVEFRMSNAWNASNMVDSTIDLQKTFRPHYMGIESEFGGTVLADDLYQRADAQSLMIPVVLVPTQGIQKEVRIRRLTPYLARGMVKFRNTEQTRIGVTQLESFPHGMHDDAPDALEGVIRILNESGLV